MADLSLIRVVRKRKKITLNELSRATELSPGYIADLEKGVKNNPTVDTLEKLAKALGISVSELVGYTQNNASY